MCLTEVVCTAEVEDVTAVDVVVQGFLYQVLGLVTCELGYPGEKLKPMQPFLENNVKFLPYLSTNYLESRKMSFMSRLARNMNMLLCSLISVTALGGRE